MADKFKDIKVGDKVLVPVHSNCLYTGNYSFLAKATVSRTTDAQFLVGAVRFRKDSGKEISSSYHTYAYVAIYDPDKDETSAYREHQEKVDLYRNTILCIDSINLPEFKNLSKEALTTIAEKVDEIIVTIEGINNDYI